MSTQPTAGDAFVGALAAGDSLPDAVSTAVRVGAVAVGGKGAQPSYPSLADELPECRDPRINGTPGVPFLFAED